MVVIYSMDNRKIYNDWKEIKVSGKDIHGEYGVYIYTSYGNDCLFSDEKLSNCKNFLENIFDAIANGWETIYINWDGTIKERTK